MEPTLLDTIRSIFKYTDGKLYRVCGTSGKWKLVNTAKSNRSGGYVHTSVVGKFIGVHRIIFALVNDRLAESVHHKNGVKTDNRPENLEELTASDHTALHTASRDMHVAYKDKACGVFLRPDKGNKFYASIQYAGKLVHLGVFDTEALAMAAYVKAKDKILAGDTEDLNSDTYAQKRRRAGHLKGASWHKSGNCWRATITVAGKSIHLGRFDTEQEAHEAYKKYLQERTKT
jgi:hypothetical protein